jgi:hypothetical protein
VKALRCERTPTIQIVDVGIEAARVLHRWVEAMLAETCEARPAKVCCIVTLPGCREAASGMPQAAASSIAQAPGRRPLNRWRSRIVYPSYLAEVQTRRHDFDIPLAERILDDILVFLHLHGEK